jgi:hypothetical protein
MAAALAAVSVSVLRFIGSRWCGRSDDAIESVPEQAANRERLRPRSNGDVEGRELRLIDTHDQV